MFTNDMKNFHFVRSSDDHVTLQNDLAIGLLYKWSVHWQLKFNISKCKHVATLWPSTSVWVVFFEWHYD